MSTALDNTVETALATCVQVRHSRVYAEVHFDALALPPLLKKRYDAHSAKALVRFAQRFNEYINKSNRAMPYHCMTNSCNFSHLAPAHAESFAEDLRGILREVLTPEALAA